MSRPAIRHRPLSVEDYLELEEMSSVRHEYIAGRIYALSGASKRHNQIALNIAGRLLSATRGGPCRIYMSDVKLRAAEDVIYYPDVMVACGPEGEHPLIEDAPCLVVEVISPSTETIDRREKLAAYKRIPTLQAYVIVDQDMRRVERHWRDPEGVWWDADLVGEGRVPLPCPEVELTLDEIYEGVQISE
jgi:Uma2 family endonuclease